MRTLDELGISPAPWDYQPNNPQGITVADRGNWTICCLPNPADARLIAAAPKCYEALRLILETLDVYGFQPILEGDPLAVAVKCGQEAIKKASGESEARVWCKHDPTRKCVDCEGCPDESEANDE